MTDLRNLKTRDLVVMILEDDRDDEARREVEARGFDVEETLSRPMSEWD